jgi:hypothetical protein
VILPSPFKRWYSNSTITFTERTLDVYFDVVHSEDVRDERIDRFMHMAIEMLGRDEFLFPYLWAQRQYRDDQYQMASAAQLEDLFFDTLGAFVRQHVPGEVFDRRQGKEPWDYAFAGLRLSHKEGKTPSLTAIWQPGLGQGNKEPLYETWNFQHPVVFVYTPKTVKCSWRSGIPIHNSEPKELTGFCMPVSHDALALKSNANAMVLFASLEGRSLTANRMWTMQEWQQLSVHDLRALVGSPRQSFTDFWLDQTRKTTGLGSLPRHDVQFPVTLALQTQPLMPGLYLLTPRELSDLPLESNNKAHYIPRKTLQPAMEAARTAGRFIPLPLWTMEFADVTPPNLYAQQRKRYDEFMAARN